MRDPSPRAMKGGVPPTLRNARTGELTPPGISFWARANRSSERERFMANSSFARNQFLIEEVQHDILQGAVKILEQAALQAEIRLSASQQILDEGPEARAAA